MSERQDQIQKQDLPRVTIYTDGACSGNPGPGGYAAILTFTRSNGEVVTKVVSGGYADTTNNRMEIMAAIKGLESLKRPCEVTLCSDAKYLVDAMSKGWVAKWNNSGWKRKKNEPVKNPDLWKQLLTLCQHYVVTFEWVKGHDGNPLNEECDRLAVEALKQPNLPRDEEFDNGVNEPVNAVENGRIVLVRADEAGDEVAG